MNRRTFTLVLVVATAVVITFLALPLVALFLRSSPGDLLDAIGSDAATEAVLVSLRTTAVAQVLILIFGTPAAYLLATRTFKGRRALITLIELPLVLPPAVAGIALLAAFGRLGIAGGALRVLGLTIPFTSAAVVLAVAFVAGPFYIRQAIASFMAVDPALIDASRSLGAGPFRTFRAVALPLAASGLGAGVALSLARGLGEFGATIMFAGSIPRITQTLPLAIYAQLDQNFDVALAIGALLVIFSATLLFALRSVASWDQWTSIYPSRSATSR